VHVHGTKRDGRRRDVPLIMAPVIPSMHRRTFEDRVRQRTARAIVTYDLRRTYSNWMESAGIPRTRRRMYMGHGAKDVTDLYERHEVAAYLLEDATKLKAFLGFPIDNVPRRLVKEG
jgi:integrase